MSNNFNIIRSVGEECQEDDELRCLINKNEDFIIYDGFEPSGRMHIAQGLLKTINVNKCTSVGGKFIFWIADWFALMNDKMGGDINKIDVVGEYLIEVWKAAGMNLDRVKFIKSSEAINNNPEEYWTMVLDISRSFTLKRIVRCCQIMGRLENNLTCAQILYPMMQCADIFFLNADVCQLGLDQKKVNMLAREYSSGKSKKNIKKPIILSHHMMHGLQEGQEKMSKSNKMSAIFMEDDEESVISKINGACYSSLMDIISTLIFTDEDSRFIINNVIFSSIKEIEDSDIDKQHLKDAISGYLNTKLSPIRRHFVENEKARSILTKIKEWNTKEIIFPKIINRRSTNRVVFIPVILEDEISINQVVSIGMAARNFNNQEIQVNIMIMDWISFGKYDKLSHDMYSALNNFIKNDNTKITIQSDIILSDPNKYWFNVINLSREIYLEEIIGHIKEDVGRASDIISAIMLIGNIHLNNSCTVASLNTKFNDVIADKCHDFSIIPDFFPCYDKKRRLLLNTDKKGIENIINKAFCSKEDPENFVLVYCKTIMKLTGNPISITKKDGKIITYHTPETLHSSFIDGDVHPGDLKTSLIEVIILFRNSHYFN